ncbi:hypothetical protein BC628DRAFT_1421595 [Trametes gibbosa]|nr:hypothetical protein BC628DRAFT_1421595 [Trametes gibbosa]
MTELATTTSHSRLTAKPKQPTILQGVDSVKLPGFELWMAYNILNVFVVPTQIDVDGFMKALCETLSLYPHAAGRLVRSSQDDWQIVLSNFAVPVERDLRGFQPVKDDSADGESRLLLFKLTLSEAETAIAVSWHHTLGDAFVIDAFMRSSVSLIILPRVLSNIRLGSTSRLPIQLKERVVEVVGPAIPISAQDVLTAYIVNVLNRYLDDPITYRNVPEVVHSPRVAGNALSIVPTVPIQREPFSNIPETALAVRQSILQCRDMTFTEEYMAVANTLMLTAANRNHSPFYEAFPGKLAVNSHSMIDRRAAHFGFPDSVQFYAVGLNDRYVRVFKSNPAPCVESQGGEHAADECWDVFFAISSKIRDEVAGAIESELHAPDFPYNIDVTSSVAVHE